MQLALGPPVGTRSRPSNNTSAGSWEQALPRLSFPGLGGQATPESQQASADRSLLSLQPGCWAGSCLQGPAGPAPGRHSPESSDSTGMSVLVSSPALPVGGGRQGGRGEAPSSVFIHSTVITHLLCLSTGDMGTEEMGTNNTLLTFFSERREN